DYSEKDNVRLMLGQVEADRGNAEAAIKWFESIAPGTSVYMPAQVSIARALLKQSGMEAARGHLRGIRTDSPIEQVQLIMAEAGLLRETGDDRGAFDTLEAATREYAGIADLWYDHGMAAERLDMLEVAEGSLRRVIELKPDHAHAYNALGFSLADRNVRLLEARGYIEQALQLAPEDPYIIDSLGWVQFRLGEFEEAEKTLRRAMSIKDDPEVVAHLAEVLVKLDKAAEARKLIAGGLSKNPGNSALQAAQSRLSP
ncbi:MAG: Beta-barrel assembly-enhancing protease, partial [Pseudomonadota bacterium]